MRKKKWSRQPARGGFTLVEIIVIVVIIGILGTVVAVRLLPQIGRSRTNTAGLEAASLANQVTSFIADHGPPSPGSGIDILWERPSNVDADGWEPYVQKPEDLLDPWGNKYILRIPGEKNRDFDVVSYGADGAPGGEGENQDVVKP